MKRFFTLTFFSLIVLGLNAQTRYVDEIFTEVAVESDIVYANNVTVITGMPVPVDIQLDVYTPVGDTETNRPLIKVFHTGNFLPPLINGQINGDKTDPYVVDMIERLVRRGYVVASVNYRLGWNPISPDQDVRTETLINAAYRGVQDSHAATRFFRKSVEEGNPYGISGEQIVNWGVGTGGYLTLGAGTINEYNDVVLPKFINANQIPMVLEGVHGDPFGEQMAAINIPNHIGYSNDINLTVNMGGATEISWLNDDEPNATPPKVADGPIISFAVPTDPFAPYGTDFLIVPTTGDIVVEISGSYDLQTRATELALNTVFTEGTLYDDAWTTSANTNNDGNEGLYPFLRPSWDLDMDPLTPAAEESAPWDWWDAAFWSTQAPAACGGAPIELCNWDLLSRRNNPDASFEKGTTYMDSIINFYAPRACVTLDLPCAAMFQDNAVTEILDASVLTLAPNPASTSVKVSAEGKTIKSIAIFGMDGRLYNQITNVNAESATIQRNNLPTGIYFVKAYFEEGIATQKVTFE
jgi:hypothetical protein